MDSENYKEANGNYKPTIKDKDGKDVVTPYEKLDENQKKVLSKNDEAKMDSLITTHQGNKQVKDNKIDLFVQKYKEFTITDDETIDCAFSRFNTIITSLKALDKSFSSRNQVRKFLSALPSKWRPKNKKEKYKSLALKARQVLSDDDTSSSDSNDENFRKIKEDKKEDRRCFKCGDPNHFISDCPKNSSGDQKAFVVGSWSDSRDDSKKEEICLMAHSNGKAYVVLNKETMKVEESLNVKFDETPPPNSPPLVDDDLLEVDIIENQKPKNIKEAIQDESWTMAMQEELNQFKTNDVWCLVPPPKNQTIIGTKWVFKNKLDENGVMSRNKARLVAQGYNQQEGIYFDETYAPVARLESIRILLAYACAHDFKLFQMDVKSTFLNGFINEEVYVAQPPRFVDFEKPNHVFKLKKALYGLKQAPKAWYDQLKAFLLDHNLLYLTASRPDIMFSVCLCARFQGAPNTSYFEAVKRIFHYIKGTSHLGLWYPKGTGLETIVYADSDHSGDYVDRKSTSGVCTFIGWCLTSWMSKKQTALAISTSEGEYVSARKACQQALWMKQALVDYEVKLNDVHVLCDNKGAIDLSKNPILHSRTKHIVIRHHFLRDNVQKGNISIEKVASEDNIANILTKPLKREPFNLLRLGLGLMEPNV
ncbi:retrovirus-related pol polyprotein from transposon TNT 1-94 [Tanacetum coccineum]